jgi:hypothetical protein
LPSRLDGSDALSISALKGKGIQDLLHRIDDSLPLRRGFRSTYSLDRPNRPR